MRKIGLLALTMSAICLVFGSFAFSQESINEQSITESKLRPNYNEKELLAFLNEKKDQADINFIIEKSAKFTGSNSLVYAEICFRIAKLLTNKNRLYKAYEYLDRVSTILEKYDISKVSFAVEFFKMKGTYFYNFRRYEDARSILFKALNQKAVDTSLIIGVYNTLGMINVNLKALDSSVYYYNMGMDLARKTNNTSWTGVISGNLGYVYFLQGDLENAKTFLKIDKDISLKNEQNESALNAITTLIEVLLIEEKYDSIDANMKILDSLVNVVGSLKSITRYHYIKTLCWEHLGEYKKAYESHRLSVLYKDSAGREYDESNLQNMIFQFKFQKKRSENELILEKEKRTGQFFYSVTTILSIITLACIFIIYLMRKRKISEHKILELEKEKIQTELKQNESELKRILKNLVEKNEIIDSLNQEIIKSEKNKEDLSLKKEKSIIYEKINSFTLLTKNDLLEFKRLFDKIHPGFYNSLTEKHENLTKSEVILGMLIRLNLTSLEMSLILGISQDSVRKANLRLRKKLSIDSQNELANFIKMI